MDINEKMPYADYHIYIDERGIGLESMAGDPLWIIYSIYELYLLYTYNNEQIEKYFSMRKIVRDLIFNK